MRAVGEQLGEPEALCRELENPVQGSREHDDAVRARVDRGLVSRKLR